MGIKKRGISPLIASVLLIGFTIAVVAMIFIWWGDFVKQKAIKEELKNEAERTCTSQVDMEVKGVQKTAGGLNFVINNRGSQSIEAFRFRIEDKGSIISIFVPYTIKSISQETVPVTKSGKDSSGNAYTLDNPTQAQIIPVVVVHSEEGSLSYSCTNPVIKIKIEGGE